MVGQVQIIVHLPQFNAVAEHQTFAKGGPGLEHFKMALSDAGLNIPGCIFVDFTVVSNGKAENALFYGGFAQKGDRMFRVPGCVAVGMAVEYIQVHKDPLFLCVVKIV